MTRELLVHGGDAGAAAGGDWWGRGGHFGSDREADRAGVGAAGEVVGVSAGR